MLKLFILFEVYLLVTYIWCCGDCEENHALYDRDSNIFLTEYKKANSYYVNETCGGCLCFLDVIESDLRPFKNGIKEETLRLCPSRGVKYQLIKGDWYRSKECVFPSRCEGVEYFLNNLRHELPDMELCINFHDWPQIEKHHSLIFPVFSFSKTNDYYDIMYPAWSFWKGGPAIKLIPEGLGRWDLGRKSMMNSANRWPWEKKTDIAFFRGSRTSTERDNIVLLSRENPKLANAAYTKNQAWKSEKDTLGLPPFDEVSLEDHCKYRYLLNFRGVTASFRFKYLFLCKSLVIHVGNEWKEFFYSALKPWVHYVPLGNRATIKEYRSLLNFLKHEDGIAKIIASRGRNFIEKNLKLDDIICYWKNLLKQYSNLLKYKVKLDSSLISVKYRS